MTVSGTPDPRPIPFWDAAELSAAIRERRVSCVEVMTAHLDHIDALNPQVNAIVMLRPREELLAEAAEKDALLDADSYQGWMHGFPHAVKDLADVRGFPTTYGFFRPDEVPVATQDSLFVERIRAAGAIFVGKTNTPEFGLGSHTYNNVFGTTRNAYDQARSAGGSSGGAAVAVALRMLPVADGSDFMGSLRNPPGWNNVLGLRPSFGRVPGAGEDVFHAQGAVDGPIARTAEDLALLLRTMSGYDARAPLSIGEDLPETGASVAGRSVAWLGDLGGYLPMDPEVLRVCESALGAFTELGMSVSPLDGLPTSAGFAGNADLWPLWLIYRHWLAGGKLAALHAVPELRARLKPEAVFEVEGVGPLTAQDVYDSGAKRSAMYQAFAEVFDTHDYVVLPTAQVFPFAAEQDWPSRVNGVGMSSYHRWMEVSTIGTLLNAPTLAMPAGFSRGGLPIGLQVIGRNHADASLLDLASAWERQTPWAQRAPALLG